MATVGRPRDSCVWNYFEYLEEKDKNEYLVTLGDGEHGQRGHSTKGTITKMLHIIVTKTITKTKLDLLLKLLLILKLFSLPKQHQ